MNVIKKNDLIKIGNVVGIVLCCIMVFGCQETVKEQEPDKTMINEKLVSSFNDKAIQNAIISQHTIYSYHFVNNSDKLNELGMRDLAVLADHYKNNPGQLSVCKDNVPDSLYQARVDFVLNQLKESGIDIGRISVSDGMPGGQGMPSEKVLDIIANKEKPIIKKSTMSSGSGASMSGGRY